MNRQGLDRNMAAYIGRLAAAGRDLVELVDRDPASPAYGCFYYPYWRSKSADYANARCQEAAYSLALLWKKNYPGNRLAGRREILELARAAALFWVRLQHRDGSFDEWYRGEHGFAATAFSAFALSRTFALIGDEFSNSHRLRLLTAFHSAADWLARHNDLEKINHQAVGAAALFSLGEILDEEEYNREAERKIGEVLDRQTEEGWFPELGGVDTGYSFLTLEYLAYAYSFSPAENLRNSLDRALDFLSYFVHPDLTTGREYNLCGNSYVSLLAAAILSEYSPRARGLLSAGLRFGDPLRQLAQDDLSRTYHLYNGLLVYDYFQKNLSAFEGEIQPLPFLGEPYRRFFPEAALLSVKTGNYFAAGGGHSGGLVKIFPLPASDSSAPISCRDSGYTIRLPDGGSRSSSRLDRGNPVGWDGKSRLEVEAGFRSGSYFFPGGFSRFLLRMVSALPGGYRLIKKGTDYLRRRKNASFQLQAVSGKAADQKLSRIIIFSPDEVRIRDAISGLPPKGAYRLKADLETSHNGLVQWRLEDQGRLMVTGSDAGVLKLGKIIKPSPGGISVSPLLEAGE